MTYRHEQILNAPAGRVAAFFNDTANLPRVSPRFPVMTVPEGRTRVFPGLTLCIRLSAGPFSVCWRTAIESVADDGSFVDVHTGPVFRSWRHRHRFEPEGSRCRVLDEIEARPVWWFAPVAGIFIRGLFRFRRFALAKEFT